MNIILRALSLMILPFVFEVEANDSDLGIDCLAQNIYFEARGEDVEGRLAVAFVTLNRVKSDRFPNTICGVVKQAKYSKWWKEKHGKDVPLKNQCHFSWYCDGRADTIHNEDAWVKAKALAEYVLEGHYIDNTNGALYYHAKRVDPWWKKHYTKTVTIGNHHFYASL